MNSAPCDPQGSSFSTPGFTPGSLPVLLPIPDPTQSHSITLVQTGFLIISMRTSLMVSLHLTLALFPLIALLRRGPWVRVPARSQLQTIERTFKTTFMLFPPA